MGCIIPGLRDRDLKKTGISRYGFISTAEILFSDAVRKICENDTCRLYGRTWACPPAVGTVEQCRQRCLRYEKAMVFDAVYPLTDPFDYEGMTEGHRAFKKLCDRPVSYTHLFPAGEPLRAGRAVCGAGRAAGRAGPGGAAGHKKHDGRPCLDAPERPGGRGKEAGGRGHARAGRVRRLPDAGNGAGRPGRRGAGRPHGRHGPFALRDALYRAEGAHPCAGCLLYTSRWRTLRR